MLDDMANMQNSIAKLRKKLTNVPESQRDSQLAVIYISNGEVRLTQKGITSSSMVAKEAKENRAFDSLLIEAQNVLLKKSGSAQVVAEVDSGLIGFVENQGKMGGGIIMAQRDSGAPSLPCTVCFSAGRVIDANEVKFGKPSRYVYMNAPAEIEFSWATNKDGKLSFMLPVVFGITNFERYEFIKVMKRGIELLGARKPEFSGYEFVQEGMAFMGGFVGAPKIYEEGHEVGGALFAIEHDNGSSDIIRPIIYKNYLNGLSEGTVLCDIEARGGELLTTNLENLKPLDRPMVYVYGPDAKALVFQSGKFTYETSGFYEFMERSGMKQAIADGKTTGLTSQVRTLIFGEYDTVSYGSNSTLQMQYKGSISNALKDLWKETKRNDVLTLGLD